MPFFPAIDQYENRIKNQTANKKRIRRKSATLQVRPLLAGFIRFRGKRVWSSSLKPTKKKSGSKQIIARGSMAVEASISLSLFVFAAVCMAMPMKMMDRQRQIQAITETVCKRYSQYAYLGAGDNGMEIGTELLGSSQIKGKINQEGIRALSFRKSSVLKDGETINFTLNYDMELPFSILGLHAIPMEVRSIRRAWIGSTGILGFERTQSEEGSLSGKEEIVYIGRNSTRYHKTRGCHYLSNELQPVLYDSLETYRNGSGARYGPCHVCGKGAGSGTTVYIMPSGESYHTDWSCSAIISYVEAVPLSQVESLGKCSYCW